MRYRKRRLTVVEEMIIDDVERQGGEVRSLFKLTDRLDIHYAHARRCVWQLDELGLLDVERQGKPGKVALVLRVPNGVGSAQTSGCSEDLEEVNLMGRVGADPLKPQPMNHKLQRKGNMATNPVDELRKDLTASNDQIELLKFANQLNSVKDTRLRGVLISTLLFENARLTSELNSARVSLGLEPVPTYKPRIR